MAMRTYGTMAVDWEERVNFERLRRERLARAKAQVQAAQPGTTSCTARGSARGARGPASRCSAGR